MTILTRLHQDLEKYFLLNHPFYQAWNEGKLSQSDLKKYSQEYYYHVAAFPRYLSAIHTQCEDLSARQVLLGNLIEEEQGEKNHPTLWKNFAKGLGCVETDFDMQNLANTRPETQVLVNDYFDLTRSDYATGLGALYAYERQTPAVSQSKIEGLKNHYAISDPDILEFFTVHQAADEWHTQECADLIEKLNPEQAERAYQGAIQGAKLLWDFLSGQLEASQVICDKHAVCA